jgi:5-methyltetrahydropteroyltriglutamate--homocysteine methyltransferase
MWIAMRLEGSHVAGLMPRSETLIASYRRLAAGRESPDSLRKLAQEETHETISIQLKSGITFAVEGQLLWHDLLRPFTDSLGGLRPGPLTRWFDNNLFYRKPVIVAKLERTAPILPKYLFTELLDGLAWKLVLPEPYTFYSLSDDQAYRSPEEAVLDLAAIFSEELRTLAPRQPAILQLTAPSIAFKTLSQDEIEIVKESVRTVRKGFGEKVMLHIPFADASKAFPWILDLGADIVGVDPYLTELKALKEYSFEGSLAVGAMDSRNSYIESIEELKRILDAASTVEARSLHLTTSADMEALPRGVSISKVKRLGEAFRALREGDLS